MTNPVLVSYGALLLAIVFEVVGTALLQISEQFTRPFPTAFMAICYTASFYFLSISLKTIPVGIAYGIWSALGIVLISAVGLFAFKQALDAPALAGLALIVTGVVVIHMFSNAISH